MKFSALVGRICSGVRESPSFAQNTRWNELANLPFQQDYLTEDTAQRLTDELLSSAAS